MVQLNCNILLNYIQYWEMYKYNKLQLLQFYHKSRSGLQL